MYSKYYIIFFFFKSIISKLLYFCSPLIKLQIILAETSWMQGGSRPQMPQGAGSVTGVSGQPLHSQTPSGM